MRTVERPDEPTPAAWAQAVREHQACLAAWDDRADLEPELVMSLHGADAHLARDS